MEHYPGSEIVQRVEAILATEKSSVYVYVDGRDKAFEVEKIAKDGPFARLTNYQQEYLIRLDKLIGVKIINHA